MYLHIRRAVFAFSLMAAGCSSGGQETSNSTTLALAGCAKAPTEGKLVVHFNAGYTAVDVAEWLAGWSCRGVIVPRHLAGVQTGSSFDETVELADHAGLLDRLLAKLDLVAVSDEKSTVIVERQVSAEAVTGHVRLSPVNPPKPAVEPPSRDRRTPSRTSRFDDATKKLLEEGISKTADYQYTVSAAVRDEIIENPVKFARGARIVPSIKNGKPVGFKLYAIRPSSIYAKLGLNNGDMVSSINGRQLTTADSALETYTAVREAKKIQVEVLRRGQPVTLIYRLVD